MAKPLFLFELEGVLYNPLTPLFDKKDSLIDKNQSDIDIRWGFSDLIGKLNKWECNVGVYTRLKEKDFIQNIDKLFKNIDLKYVLNYDHCKQIDGQTIKCSDYIDMKTYQPILIDNHPELVSNDLKPYTLMVPSYSSNSFLDDLTLLNLLTPFCKILNDQSKTKEIIDIRNNRYRSIHDESCIIL